MKTAVVILPTYNEKGNIGPLIDQLEVVFGDIGNYRMKILVVDDNSPDGTQVEVRQKQKKYANVFLMTGKKEGLGQAYLRGMNYAVKKLKAEVLFEMDADHSHDPKVIPHFLKKIDQGYDLVIGSRYIKGGSIPSNWGIHRKIFSVLGNVIVRIMLFHFSQSEWTSGFRAIRRELYEKVKGELRGFKGYTFQVAFLHKAFLEGAKVTEIPIHFTDRFLGHSKIPVPEYISNLLWYLFKQTVVNPPQFIKFLVVGGIGFVLQFISFRLFRVLNFRPSVATASSAEIAIISNFILNNLWTFAAQQIKTSVKLIPKFFQFNLTSLGSIIIQASLSELGTRMFGIFLWASVLGFSVFSDDVYLIIGILLGLIWNYIMYSRVIWREKK